MNLATNILCIVLSLGTFTLPRRTFILTFIVAACLVPMNQRILIAGLDFSVLRILVMSGIVRLFIRGEILEINWNSFDILILIWNLTGSVIYIIQWGTMQAVVYKCGVLWDYLGMYLLFRQIIRSFEDIFFIVKWFAVFAILSAPLLAIEKMNQSSIFTIFGPTGEAFHRGRFRCAGPFSHYIMLGSFWASTLPLFYSMVKSYKNTLFYRVAIVAAIYCVYMSASSTPILTIAAMILFWSWYRWRMQGKKLFCYVCCVLLSLHLVMDKPVWHLLARVNVFGGSTGWHRYHLFDEFVNHMSEWFYLGAKTTAHWGYGLEDVTNQFVLEGIRGGFVGLFFFVLVLYNAVKISGLYSYVGSSPEEQWLSWAVCVSLLGHIVAFWGVSYFGQIYLLLGLTFAVVGFMKEQLNAKLHF